MQHPVVGCIKQMDCESSFFQAPGSEASHFGHMWACRNVVDLWRLEKTKHLRVLSLIHKPVDDES